MRNAVLIGVLGALGALCGSSAGAEKDLILELGGGASLKLVRVPAGTFRMGSPKGEKFHARNEGPQREVRISRDFYMGSCEVTRSQFAAFAKDTGYATEPEKNGWAFAWDGKKWDKVKGASWRKVGFDQTDGHPVVCVSWSDATTFCRWLGRRTGRAARLPTEAEWEYACRAGSKTAYSWGDAPKDGKGWCNAADKTGKSRFRGWHAFPWEDGRVFTARVASYRANAFGLHDMHGNAWEWCSDWYAKDRASAASVDPRGPASGTLRVIRGGSWLSNPPRCRSAFRCGVAPLGSLCDAIVGFRVVLDIP